MNEISQKETDEIIKILTSSVITSKNTFRRLAFASKLATKKLKRLGVNIDRAKKNDG